MNQLSKSTSPYLLQHANNPVNWYPWEPEALEKEGRQRKTQSPFWENLKRRATARRKAPLINFVPAMQCLLTGG